MTKLIPVASSYAGEFVAFLQKYVPESLSLLLGIPATIDWCEDNFTWSSWIAEFWNTLSSLAMVLFGLYGIWRHAIFGRRFAFVFFTFSLVGLGSILFHATLVFPFQLLDELPMCWTGFVMMYVLTERYPEPRHSVWFPACIALWAAVVTVCTSTHSNWQVYLFQGSYIVVQIFCIYAMTQFTWSGSKQRMRMRKSAAFDHTVKRIWFSGVTVYALALICWVIDFKLCDYVNGHTDHHSIIPFNPQLHAWWHVFAGFGSYLCCMMSVLIRAKHCNWDVEVAWDFGFLAYLRPGPNYKESRKRSVSPTKKRS